MRHAQRLGGLHDARLQPVDADRLLVADLVLEADVDVFAALHHLLGGLGEAGLVAVDRRELEEPGQEHEQADQGQECHRAAMGERGKVEQPAERIGRPGRLRLAFGCRQHVPSAPNPRGP